MSQKCTRRSPKKILTSWRSLFTCSQHFHCARTAVFFHPAIRMNFTLHRLVWKRLDAGVKNDYVTKIPSKMLQNIFDSLDGRNLPIFNAYSISEHAFTVSPARPPPCKILLFFLSCGWGKTTLDTGVKNDYVTKIHPNMLQNIFDPLWRYYTNFERYSLWTVICISTLCHQFFPFTLSCGWSTKTLDTGVKNDYVTKIHPKYAVKYFWPPWRSYYTNFQRYSLWTVIRISAHCDQFSRFTLSCGWSIKTLDTGVKNDYVTKIHPNML